MNLISEFFIDPYRNKEAFIIILEAIVFVFIILSVWFAKKKNIWVYPTGLIATVQTVYVVLARTHGRHGYEFLLLRDEYLWLVDLVPNQE
jgi:nicotinamide riboside transporter PnuC